MTLCVASQQLFIVSVYFVTTQSGNFWIYPRIPPNDRKVIRNSELRRTRKLSWPILRYYPGV
jgi:hypothetical protein